MRNLLHRLTGLTRPAWIKNTTKTHHREDDEYLHVYIDGKLHQFTQEAIAVAKARGNA